MVPPALWIAHGNQLEVNHAFCQDRKRTNVRHKNYNTAGEKLQEKIEHLFDENL